MEKNKKQPNFSGFLAKNLQVDEDYWKKLADIDDQRLKEAFVGAIITNFEVKRIKGRKRMVEVTIETTAKPVPAASMKNVYYLTNPLTFRVKF